MHTWKRFYRSARLWEVDQSGQLDAFVGKLDPLLQRLYNWMAKNKQNFDEAKQEAFENFLIQRAQQVVQSGRIPMPEQFIKDAIRAMGDNPQMAALAGLLKVAWTSSAVTARPAGPGTQAGAGPMGMMGGTDEYTKDSIEGAVRNYLSRKGSSVSGMVRELDMSLQQAIKAKMPVHPSISKAMMAGRGLQVYQTKNGDLGFILNP